VQVVDATPYLAPYPPRRVRRPVRLTLTDATYALEPTPEQAWLPIAFRAFARLARRIAVRDVLVVGTGNGLDVLGAAEIFEDLRSVTATDLHDAGLRVARENVLAHLEDPGAIELLWHAGDVLAPVPPELRFDLVYENLPNLPAGADLELRDGEIAGRFFDAAGSDDVPEPFAAHLLALHHRCLRQAHRCVRDGGGVLTAIGGRVPVEVALGLHRACGYAPELVAFDVKPQAVPELVIAPYAEAEARTGVAFTFYAPEAVELVTAARRDGLDGHELASAVADDLARYAMSAGEAARRTDRGEDVAHSVLMIFGGRGAAPVAR
jgi:SAM-dependent methyltransferase